MQALHHYAIMTIVYTLSLANLTFSYVFCDTDKFKLHEIKPQLMHVRLKIMDSALLPTEFIF